MGLLKQFHNLLVLNNCLKLKSVDCKYLYNLTSLWNLENNKYLTDLGFPDSYIDDLSKAYVKNDLTDDELEKQYKYTRYSFYGLIPFVFPFIFSLAYKMKYFKKYEIIKNYEIFAKAKMK